LQGAVGGAAADPEGRRDLPDRFAGGVQGVDLPDLPGGEPGWPADVLAAGPRRVAGGGGAFVHQVAFVAGEGGEDAASIFPAGMA